MFALTSRLFDDRRPDAAGQRTYPIPWVLRTSVQAFYCDRNFQTETIGLDSAWGGSLCLNPPYGPEVRQWVAKACQEYEAGRIVEVLLLLKASTDARWFGSLMRCGALACFIQGRLRFNESARDAPFASMLAYLGPRREEFERVFGDSGPVAYARPALAEMTRSSWWNWIKERTPRWLRHSRFRCSG